MSKVHHLQQLLREQKKDENVQTLTIRFGNAETRRTVNRFLHALDYCARAGCSREFRFPVDGDGFFSLRIKGLDDLPKEDHLDTTDDPIHVPSGD